MKKIMTCFLSMILCFTFLYTPNNTVEAYTSNSIENNTIKFLTYEYPYDIKQRVLEFKFVDQGNNTAKLKTYYNGKFIEINEIPSNLALYSDLGFTLTNIYGYANTDYLDRGTSMRFIARYLEALTNTNISLEGSNSEESITGEVERIGLVVKDGSSIYDIKIKGIDKYFSVSTETSREVALTNVGDTVFIKFIQVGDGQYIITNSFENLSLKNSSSNSESVDNTIETTDSISKME